MIQRSKTVPVKDTNITLRTHHQSPQQQKLEEYLSWEQKQKEKRHRLERYLAHMQVDEESCDNQNAPQHGGIQTVKFQKLRIDTLKRLLDFYFYSCIIFNRFFQS